MSARQALCSAVQLIDDAVRNLGARNHFIRVIQVSVQGVCEDCDDQIHSRLLHPSLKRSGHRLPCDILEVSQGGTLSKVQNGEH